MLQEILHRGLYGNETWAVITDCTFVDNHATFAGGGIYVQYSGPVVSNCRFYGNSAVHEVFGESGHGYGGGMCNSGSSPRIVNCSFVENWARHGGAVYNDNSYYGGPEIINDTFVGNTAIETGNAVYVYGLSELPRIANSVFWGNGGLQPIEYHWQIFPVVEYCNVEAGFDGTGNVNADPLLVAVPWPGPDGNWGTPDDDDGDLSPHPGSPCVDAGSNDAVPPEVQTDQSGQPRFVDTGSRVDTGVGDGPIVDMGALEHQACHADLNDDDVVDAGDLTLVIINWGNPGGVGDINLDGVVDVRDLLEIILHWGPCG